MNVFIHVIDSFGSGATGYNVGVVFFDEDIEDHEDIDTWFGKRFEEFQASEPVSDCEFPVWLMRETRQVTLSREGYAPLESHHHVFVSNL